MASPKGQVDVGLAIKFWRTARGLSQGQIARTNQWERSYISDLERGKIKNPSFDTILLLVDALQISCNDFISAGMGRFPKPTINGFPALGSDDPDKD